MSPVFASLFLLVSCSRENNSQSLQFNRNFKVGSEKVPEVEFETLKTIVQKNKDSLTKTENSCVKPFPMPRILSRREITNSLNGLFEIPVADAAFKLKWPQARSNYFSTMASDNNLSVAQMRLLLDELETDLIPVIPKITQKYSCLLNLENIQKCDAIKNIYFLVFNKQASPEEIQKLNQMYVANATEQNKSAGLLNVLLAIIMHPNFLMRPEMEKTESGLQWAQNLKVFQSLLKDVKLPQKSMLNSETMKIETTNISAGLKLFLNELLGTVYLSEETEKIAHLNKQQGALLLQKFEATLLKMTDKKDLKLSDLIGQWSADAFDKPNTILFHPTVIGIHSGSGDTKPVERGNYILNALFCQSIAPPKGVSEINNEAFKSKPSATKVDHFNFRMSRPDCAVCHGTLEPLGFLFESIDSYGNAKSQFESLPIQNFKIASNEFSGASLEEFINQAQNSNLLRRCFATQYFRYAIGRTEKDQDKCLIDGMEKSLVDSGGSLAAMESYMLKIFEEKIK